MAYKVDKFNGTFLVSVADGTIDTTTDLRFVGKNYAGYGEVQNENFLHLLENFTNTTPPPNAITGQIWYDSSTKKLKFYDGVKFKVASGAEVASLAPTGMTRGDFWWDTSTKQLYVWSGTDYELIGPESSPELGQTAVVSTVVRDSEELPLTHSIIKFLVGGKCVAIISKDEFILSHADAITGFPLIKKGYTLVNTGADGVTSDDYIHWGTASNALKLAGYDGDDYILKSDVYFPNSVHFAQGYTLGGDLADYNLRVFPDGTDVVIESIKGYNSNITVRMRESETVDHNVAVFTKAGINPGLTSTYNLGTDALRWKTIYADDINVGSIHGDIHGDTYGSHYGNVYHWDGSATDGTIIINAATKQIGFDGALLRGDLIGNVQGNVIGTASNADKLANKEGTVYTPTTGDKSSVVVRAIDGAVYASRFVGPADSALKLKIDDNIVDVAWNAGDESTMYRSAKTTKTAYSIAARDASGDLAANIFNGTATAARFADLAEKYLADEEYEVGTVVSVGGAAEVTACRVGDRALGTVSENPAYMMNSELEGGTYIALKGRVPCKVIGSVKKGQQLWASIDGCASVSPINSSVVFAIALESNSSADKKIIEVVIL